MMDSGKLIGSKSKVPKQRTDLELFKNFNRDPEFITEVSEIIILPLFLMKPGFVR